MGLARNWRIAAVSFAGGGVNMANFSDEDWVADYGPAPAQPVQPGETGVVIPFAPPEAYGDAQADEQTPITATQFAWRDEADIPARQWLYGKHLLRRFVSVDVAAGGTG